jgi:EpsI family protein
VSSNNTLTQSEDKLWNRLQLPPAVLDISGAKTQFVAHKISGSADLTRINNKTLQVWQTYWIDGELLTNDYRAKLRTAQLRLSGRGDDGASIVLFTKGEDEQQSAAVLTRFAQSQLPALLAELRSTQSRR